MKVPFLDLQRQYQSIKPEIDAAIARIIANSSFIMGKEVSQFEEAFAKACGAQHAVGCSSGTSALQLALKAGGIRPADEVITVSNTFIATTEAITLVGAKSVFVEIDPQTYNLDPAALAKAITPRTKAVIAVHLYGQPGALAKIQKICKEHQLLLIGDAAQAHLAAYQEKSITQWADLTAFSFFPGKNLGAYGDAGAVVTDNAEWAHQLRLLRNHGRVEKYEHLIEGDNCRLDALQAAILGVKLPRLAEWTRQRRAHVAAYREQLQGVTGLTLPYENPDCYHVYHLFVVRVPRRDEVMQKLTAAGIGCGVHYPLPLHLQPAYKYLGYQPGDFPLTEKYAQQIISLPMFAELTAAEITYTCATLKQILQEF